MEYPETPEEIIMPVMVNPGEFFVLNPCSGECHHVQWRENPRRPRRKRKKQTVYLAPTPYDDLEVRVALIRAPSAGQYAAFIIRSSEDIYKLMRFAINEPQECIYVVGMNAHHVVLGVVKVAVGALSRAVIEPRDLLLPLMLLRAAAFAVVHNHPSGAPEPSSDDELMATTVFEAGALLGFRLLDFVIIGDGGYVSLADRGVL